MIRVLESSGLTDVDAFCTTTGVFASATQNDKVLTLIRRVKSRTNNFTKVACVNSISRSYVEGKININEAILKIQNIKDSPPYPALARIAWAAVASFCFAIMFGGSYFDAANAFIAATFMQIPVFFLAKYDVVAVLLNIIGGLLSGVFGIIILNIGLGQNINYIIIGAIMPLVPGVSLTNAIRDVLQGDLLSGSSRMLDAALVAVSIAAGVGAALTTWINLFGGIVL